jgi:hypothetical protein
MLAGGGRARRAIGAAGARADRRALPAGLAFGRRAPRRRLAAAAAAAAALPASAASTKVSMQTLDTCELAVSRCGAAEGATNCACASDHGCCL